MFISIELTQGNMSTSVEREGMLNVKMDSKENCDSPFWQGWGNLRLNTLCLIQNMYWQMGVLMMILISIITLPLENDQLPKRPILQDILYYTDRIMAAFFLLEMLIKWVALGFKAYFSNIWHWLGFVIVMYRFSKCWSTLDLSFYGHGIRILMIFIHAVYVSKLISPEKKDKEIFE